MTEIKCPICGCNDLIPYDLDDGIDLSDDAVFVPFRSYHRPPNFETYVCTGCRHIEFLAVKASLERRLHDKAEWECASAEKESIESRLDELRKELASLEITTDDADIAANDADDISMRCDTIRHEIEHLKHRLNEIDVVLLSRCGWPL